MDYMSLRCSLHFYYRISHLLITISSVPGVQSFTITMPMVAVVATVSVMLTIRSML